MFQGHLNLDTAMPVEAGANGDVLFDLGMLYASGRSARSIWWPRTSGSTWLRSRAASMRFRCAVRSPR